MSVDTIESTLPKLLEFRRDREWEQFHSPKNIAMALSIEASELLEQFLWRENETSKEITRDQNRMYSIREEIADVMIYLLFLSYDLDINIPVAIREKLVKNGEKYPVSEYRGRF
jgi:NTP pyrophosphatase (non-canonical NTP hydrolase)